MKNDLKPNFISSFKKIKKSTIKASSPYPEVNASYNWLNTDFPYIHTHSEWEILIVTEGKLKHIINGYHEIGDAGYACLIRPSDCHRIEYAGKDEKPQYINFVFSNEIASKLFNVYDGFNIDFKSDKPLRFSLSPFLLDSIVRQSVIMQSAEKRIYEQYSILTVNQLVAEFLSQNLIKNSEYPDWLNAFLHNLHNPNNFRLPLTAMAKFSPYSYSYLTRVFKKIMGETIKEYIEKIKIIYVKRLLRTTTKSILEISLDVGYDSVSSLNHNFKAATSLTPSLYRKQHRPTSN